MGNKIARTTQVSATEYYLHDLPSSYNLVLIEILERGRFFKSILCKHDEGLVLVKVYFKRGDPLDLTDYKRRLSEIKEIFKSVPDPHVWPFDRWQETDKAAYLLRQYFFSNLHDRLSTRPFLSHIEKKWLAFQLMCAVAQSHSAGVCHGDIKCENVLVTSWNWLYLADFASFKPTYIPDDDPSDFSFFFDTGGRRRCYLAPERFYEPGGESVGAHDAPLKPSMDIFSLGCVIAELFLEGQPLFELSQLLAYRRGQYDPSQHLEKIQDIGMRKMILHMIQLDPDLRKSCDSYLQTYVSSIFPNYFSPFLHKFFSLLSPCDSDNRVKVTQSAFPTIYEQMMSNGCIEDVISESSTSIEHPNNEALHRTEGGREGPNLSQGAVTDHAQLVGEINALLKETELGNNILSKEKRTEAKVAVPNYSKSIPSPKHILNSRRKTVNDCAISSDNDAPVLRKFLKSDLHTLLLDGHDTLMDTYEIPFFQAKESKPSCEGMVLIASLLCSCLRSVKQVQLRRGCLILLKKCSYYIDDEDRLQHVLPYVIVMLSDPAAIVRCAALETLCDILPLVQEFPPSDAMIFPEYILPMLSMLPDDPEESVRICYASNIYKIALTAYRFLICSQGLAGGGSPGKSVLAYKSQLLAAESAGRKSGNKGEEQLLKLRKSIAEIIQELVIGLKQTPNIRRALLNNIGYLCFFFGHQQCNDFLLPILPAFLNDRDEQLRAVFYEQIVFVCYFVGQTSIEEYLLPYIEQALSDEMEVVIVNALECLSMLCRSGFLRKRILLCLIDKIVPLLRYPIQWVRRLAVSFIAACCSSLGEIDSYVYISPVLRPLFHNQPASLTSEEAILSSLKPPVSKIVFYQALEKARSSDMLERQRKIWYNSSSGTNQWETVELARKSGNMKSISSFGRKESDAQIGTYTNNVKRAVSLSVAEDNSKLRVGTLIQNASCIGGDSRDPLSSDKLQFSGFISPHVGAGDGTFSDGHFEGGIPLYSFCMDKRIVGVPIGSESTLYRNAKGVAASCMPSMDVANGPSNLSSSVPPKLGSDSFFNIHDNVKEAEKTVQYSEIRESEHFSFVTSKFQEIHDPVKESSTSTVDEDSELNGLHPFARVPSIPDAGWRPRGVLVAHLQEHRSAVNDIAISNDDTFFVSASDDSTVKIWDTRKLEKDISFRSRLTYSLDGSRALCTTMLRGTAQVLVGASDGVLHSFSVDYVSRGLGNVIERYSGVAGIKKRETGEGAIPSLINCSASSNLLSQTILFSTERCGIHLWDVRTTTDAWKFTTVPEDGYISSLVMSHCGNWFVSGSSRGVLTLWDVRFLLPVNSWQYPVVCPVEKMCLLIPASNSITAVTRPLVFVAVGLNEVSLWDAENGSCHQVFRIANSERETEKSNIPQQLLRPSNKQSLKMDLKRQGTDKYRIDDLKQPASRLQGIRSLLPLPGGDLITGATDLKIRYLDHTSPERSYYVCGPSMKGMRNDVYYDKRSSSGVQIVQEMSKRPAASKLTQKALLSMAATDSAGCHRDAVLSLASVKLNQRLLISSCRDGAIKVWK